MRTLPAGEVLAPRSDWRPPQHRNLLLRSLPTVEFERIAPRLVPVTLTATEVLSDPGVPPTHVHFPETAVFSMIVVMADGTAVEAATIGNEGLAGLSAFLGTAAMTARCLIQVSGQAHRMTVPAFRRAVATSPALETLLSHYTQAFINQVAQSAACNRLHALSERCARWLLMTHDRVGADQFLLTQEFLSYMLGVRRESVSEAAHRLQAAGLIRYRRGKLTILDRPGLETASCECYRTVRADYERLLG
jgi:CRP-like cAMP-binding protein